MSDTFFDEPFSEDTQVKLELYSNYVSEWVPVFLCTDRPFVNTINIFDFFAGAGTDSMGKSGSPILAIQAIMKYKYKLSRPDIKVNLYLNDKEKSYCERLKTNIDNLNFDRQNINIHYINEDFLNAYKLLKPKMAKAANLIFLDQFGVKYVGKEIFQELIKLKTTDILFFVSSSTFKRFSTDENISSILGFDASVIEKLRPAEIHRFICQAYSSFIPSHFSYSIAPFSIKKGTNIYGLIFGSGHPLGIEKFLQICWDKDSLTGEANFDIEGSRIDGSSPFMFPEMNTPKKIDVFSENLRRSILNQSLKTDLDVFIYMLNNGFIASHVKPIIQSLKDERKIYIKNPSFKSSTVWDRNRTPQKITLI